MVSEPWYMGLVEAGQAIAARKLSSVELTRAMLDRIAALDPRLHAFATLTADLALERARTADAEIAAGHARGKLHGVPIAVKDLCYTKGIPTGAGMAIHRDFRPDHDATVVARLAEAGAVSLGKLQLTEGAFGAHHPEITRPVNPWGAEAWTGVSSSGSGVATAAGLCFGSLGSDTGGSIRFPSTANGITGLKPTWGRVSRYAVFELAGSMDHIGPMTRSAIDAAAMLGAIAGADPNDPTASTSRCPTTSRASMAASAASHRRGSRAHGERGCRRAARRRRCRARAERDLGARIVPVTVPAPDRVVAEWVTLCAVEAAVAHEATFPSRADRYGPVLRALLERGRSVDGLTVSRIWTERQNFSGALATMMREIDLLLVPAMNRAALSWATIEASGREPSEIAGRLRYTAPFDMSGSPTITLPGGFTTAGLPIGFQLVGRHFDEALVLRAGHAFQSATDWHTRRPPV